MVEYTVGFLKYRLGEIFSGLIRSIIFENKVCSGIYGRVLRAQFHRILFVQLDVMEQSAKILLQNGGLVRCGSDTSATDLPTVWCGLWKIPKNVCQILVGIREGLNSTGTGN